jgi:hypothetical protein
VIEVRGVLNILNLGDFLLNLAPALYCRDMAGEKKNDPRGPNKAEPQTKAKPAPNATPGSHKKK